MECTLCGSHNAPGSEFCGNCGSPLAPPERGVREGAPHPPAAPSSEPRGKFKLGKRAVIALSILGAVLLTVAVVFGVKSSRIRKLEERLMAAEAAGDMSESLFLNQRLYELTGDGAYRREILDIQNKEKWQQLAQETSALISSGEYDLARQNILKLAGEGEDTAAMTAELQNQLNQAIAQEAALAEAELQREREEELAKEEAQPAPKQSAPRSDLADIARNLQDKYLTSTAQKSNVRSGPGLDYPIDYSLTLGSEIYVFDTRISGNIIWLYIGDGWTSHKNFNGELYY
ncbi:MAG: hypothetical protein Q4E76_06655 [Tissierellia bacterium]|nr:hypothetical protein [Tissierellia bacterium]